MGPIDRFLGGKILCVNMLSPILINGPTTSGPTTISVPNSQAQQPLVSPAVRPNKDYLAQHIGPTTIKGPTEAGSTMINGPIVSGLTMINGFLKPNNDSQPVNWPNNNP